jgi:hypothetical protein
LLKIKLNIHLKVGFLLNLYSKPHLDGQSKVEGKYETYLIDPFFKILVLFKQWHRFLIKLLKQMKEKWNELLCDGIDHLTYFVQNCLKTNVFSLCNT